LNPLERGIRLGLVAATLLVAAAAAYFIEAAPPVYAESATLMFSLPEARNSPNAYYMFAPSLIASGEAMVRILQSPAAQRRIGAAGGDGDVSLALVNLYSEQYPDYALPLATLTATGPAAANTRRTFTVAVQVLDRLFATAQQQAGVAPRYRIPVLMLGDSGPVIQAGSRTRVFGGLALLTAIAGSLAWDGAGRWGARARPGPRHRLRRNRGRIRRRSAPRPH
jgi:hypothetical protein